MSTKSPTQWLVLATWWILLVAEGDLVSGAAIIPVLNSLSAEDPAPTPKGCDMMSEVAATPRSCHGLKRVVPKKSYTMHATVIRYCSQMLRQPA
jgi:hypothetical protein